MCDVWVTVCQPFVKRIYDDSERNIVWDNVCMLLNWGRVSVLRSKDELASIKRQQYLMEESCICTGWAKKPDMLNRAIDQLPGSRVPMINFVWTNHVWKWWLLFRCVWSDNSLCKFRDSEYLCKLGKEYLNTLLCKFYTFFSSKICKLLTYHTPFYR